jgi:hypothetical protein
MRKLEQFKKEQSEAKAKLRLKSTIIIQAFIRGIVARRRFKKNLPALKKAQKQRIFCTQCEVQIALRRCRQCRDKFCNDCYDLIHQKGTALSSS